MKSLLKIWSVLILTTGLIGCSGYIYERATMKSDNLQFSRAIKDYQKVLDKKDSVGARIGLANCYLETSQNNKAEPLFAEIVTYPESDPIHMLSYARVLMAKKDYDGAKPWIRRYLDKVPNDEVASNLLTACNSEEIFMRDTTLFTIREVKYEGFASTFGQAPYLEGVIFSADKHTSKKSQQDPWSGKSYYDLYYSRKNENGHWLEPEPLKGDVNGRFHEGPAVFTKDGKLAYFTRSNYSKRRLKKSSKKENNLKIFTAKMEDGEWKNLEELPFCNDEYSVGHPALSPDEKTLYFASDMPGGLGGTDLYSSVYNGTEWSKPKNLGKRVNTAGDEMFPFIAEDGGLYFSSDAHLTMGGLDVFHSSYDVSKKAWKPVETLTYPLNSASDDFALVLLDEKSGFISSNRNSPDKIYEFEMNDPSFFVYGTVVEKATGNPLIGSTVVLKNINDNSEVTTRTDQFGKYRMPLVMNIDYDISASKENFLKSSSALSVKNRKYSEEIERNFKLDALAIEKPILVENIYYDFDKWNIRPDAAIELDKLVRTLKDNPNIDIEMGSHADARGTNAYNKRLTNRRAKSAVQYLVSRGINAKRLSWKGYGESMPLNRCKDDVQCSEEEHQMNRRTEFKVTKVNKQS